MKIVLSPVASNRTTEIFVDGLTLTVDGKVIDLSVIPEDGYAEPEMDSGLLGRVTRDEVMVEYHYDAMLAEDHQSADWEDYTFELVSGKVPCPILWKPEPDPEPVPKTDEEVEGDDI